MGPHYIIKVQGKNTPKFINVGPNKRTSKLTPIEFITTINSRFIHALKKTNFTRPPPEIGVYGILERYGDMKKSLDRLTEILD